MTFVASILGNRILATVLLAAAPIAAQVVPGNPSANSAVASALAQRKPVVPPARKSPPPTRAGFSPLTTKSELAATRVFSEPLVPVGGEPNVLENQALASALVAFEERKIPDDTSVLETYLNSFPRSPWTVSLHMNLGVFYYKRGAYSRCLVSWEKAWALGRQATALAERAVAQRALAELINMNARLGRMPRLSELLAEADTRKFSGHSAQLVSAGRAGLWLMENIPSEAFRCGPIAVSMVAKTAKRGSNVLELGLKQKSTTRGTSLDQLAQLASAMKAGLQPAFRTAEGEMIVPAVVHWKIGHFAALTQRTPTKINSKDATFGGDIWLTPSTLAEESSGYFLVPAGPLPKGWRAVGPAEAATVWGCGATTASDSDAWTATDHKVGGGCDSSGRGMPVYSFHTMLASLVLTDTPVGMTSPLGENLFFTLTYSQRASGQPTIFNHGNLGQNWTHNWTSWLDEDDSTAQSVTFHPPGGGARHFHYNANTATYDPEYNTGARLTRYEQGAGYVYNVVDTDGTIWTFTESDSRGNNQRLWLTAITDPEGNAITLSYDDYRLSDIVSGSTGYGLTFAYPPAPAGTAEYYRVASVSDKTAYARTAHIGYDGEGRLNSITDVGALTTTFEYEAVGSSFINKMISPYWAPAVGDTKPGVTTFATEQIGRKFSISATDDAGTERVEFNQISGETGMDTILPANELPAMWLSNSYIFDRNSFYWTKKAWAEGGGRDFAFAHIYHWQNKDFGSRVTCGNTLESEKPLLETRIWYAYPGQHDPSPGDPFPASAVDLPDSATSFPGSIASPSVVARKMNTPAGATTQRSFATYNEFGLPTEIIDPKGVVTSYGYSGSHLTYVGGGGQFYNVVVGTGTPRRPERIVTAAGPTDFTYNAAGQVLTTTRPDNGVTTFDYDGSGHLNFVDGPLPGPGDKTVFGRDVQFRVFSITNPSGHTTQFLYDNFDRVTRTTYPDTTYELFTYDKLDLHQVRDRRGLVTTYFHNSLRQLTQVTDPLGRISILEWCKCGSLGKLTYAGGQVVEWFYDAAGRLTSKQIASGVDSYSYDDIGRVEMTTDAKSQSKIFSYYANNTLEKITYSNATVATPAGDVHLRRRQPHGR
jgi:YD repeat-containing protein